MPMRRLPLLAATALAACAQAPAPERPPAPVAAPAPPAVAPPVAIPAGLDRDGDGALSMAEIERGARRPVPDATLVRLLDLDGDDRLSAAEREGAGERLLALDRDGDGLVGAGELAAGRGAGVTPFAF